MEGNKNNQVKMDVRMVAVLCYLVPPVTGALFFLMEKNNKFIKFHAFQSVLFGCVAYFIWIVTLSLGFLPALNVFLMPFVSLIIFSSWLLLIWEAYNNQEFELPFLGKIAKEQSKRK